MQLVIVYLSNNLISPVDVQQIFKSPPKWEGLVQMEIMDWPDLKIVQVSEDHWA